MPRAAMRAATPALRVRAARALLAGHGAVGDVALAVGYQSEAALNRVFKRHYGVGPGGYRRTMRAPAVAWIDARLTSTSSRRACCSLP